MCCLVAGQHRVPLQPRARRQHLRRRAVHRDAPAHGGDRCRPRTGRCWRRRSPARRRATAGRAPPSRRRREQQRVATGRGQRVELRPSAVIRHEDEAIARGPVQVRRRRRCPAAIRAASPAPSTPGARCRWPPQPTHRLHGTWRGVSTGSGAPPTPGRRTNATRRAVRRPARHAVARGGRAPATSPASARPCRRR